MANGNADCTGKEADRCTFEEGTVIARLVSHAQKGWKQLKRGGDTQDDAKDDQDGTEGFHGGRVSRMPVKTLCRERAFAATNA